MKARGAVKGLVLFKNALSAMGPVEPFCARFESVRMKSFSTPKASSSACMRGASFAFKLITLQEPAAGSATKKSEATLAPAVSPPSCPNQEESVWGLASTHCDTLRSSCDGDPFGQGATAPDGRHGKDKVLTPSARGVPFPSRNWPRNWPTARKRSK